MFKLITAILIFAIVGVSDSPGRAQTLMAVQKEGQGLGSADSPAYVDVDKLQPQVRRNESSTLERYNANLRPDSFYLKWEWRPNDCFAGSVLREGVAAYCFPYAMLGHHLSTLYPTMAGRFVSLGRGGLFVWHEPRRNLFYLWDSGWNFEYVLGPFVGHPRASLRNAVKPSKGKRHFPGVRLTLVSQRWVHPDERQARVPRGEHYDCAHGHPSGRSIEQTQLNSFITRLRLTNNSRSSLYYLTQSEGSDEPADYGFTKYPGQEWDRHSSPFRYREWKPTASWRPLPPGGAVGFEVTNRGWPGAEHAFVVMLNDERVFWDEVELPGKFPTMYRKVRDEQ